MSREIVYGELWFPSGISNDAKELISWCINRNPALRPTEFSQVKNHKFFEDIHWGKFTKKQAVPPWLPTLYDWHYNPKFMNIPLEEVFGNQFKKEEYEPRHSFYIELNHDSTIVEKFSTCGFGYDSIISQERPLDKIYDSGDCKGYLEGFDFVYDPEEEIVIQEQINAYKDQNRQSTKESKEETKCSESDEDSMSDEHENDDIDETDKNSLDSYKLMPITISQKIELSR